MEGRKLYQTGDRIFIRESEGWGEKRREVYVAGTVKSATKALLHIVHDNGEESHNVGNFPEYVSDTIPPGGEAKFQFKILDGRWRFFRTMRDACAYGEAVYQRTGAIVAIEAA